MKKNVCLERLTPDSSENKSLWKAEVRSVTCKIGRTKIYCIEAASVSLHHLADHTNSPSASRATGTLSRSWSLRRRSQTQHCLACITTHTQSFGKYFWHILTDLPRRWDQHSKVCMFRVRTFCWTSTHPHYWKTWWNTWPWWTSICSCNLHPGSRHCTQTAAHRTLK